MIEKMKNRKIDLFLTGMIAFSLIIAGCAPSANAQVANPALETSGQNPTIEFTLVTGESEGKLVYYGLGGAINGIVNPDLNVSPGDVVKIIMVIGDGMLHDVAIPDLKVKSEAIAEKDQQTEIIFTAADAGTMAYYCTIPGHRQAGMEGRLIVGESKQAAEEVTNASVVRSPDDLPGPLTSIVPSLVKVVLETIEVEARLSDGTSYKFWTFNGKVPGPFVRVRVGDTVEVVLKNDSGSEFMHSVDFHATTGPGGGAVATQTKPGSETTFTFKAINPGLYVYHCATPMVAHHIANGMYGLILVEPEEGLSQVDHEFYVMQGEVYTAEPLGKKGVLNFDLEKLLDEHPEYLIFNGSVGALTDEAPLKANVNDTVRIFFGVGGPNYTSSFHVIGEIFDRVYDLASLTSEPLTNVQTTLVPPGGAVMVEFGLEVPGRYLLVDHALSRLERGLVGFLMVKGAENKEIFNPEPNPGSGN
jgi:nitrite reductase (NO-forming)